MIIFSAYSDCWNLAFLFRSLPVFQGAYDVSTSGAQLMSLLNGPVGLVLMSVLQLVSQMMQICGRRLFGKSVSAVTQRWSVLKAIKGCLLLSNFMQ